MSRLPLRRQLAALTASLVLAGCAHQAGPVTGVVPAPAAPQPASIPSTTMNSVAEAYVKLVLAVGVHDANYVDAYYGPAEWQTAATASPVPLTTIRDRAAELRARLGKLDLAGVDEMGRLRHRYLDVQLAALAARVAMLLGTKYTFDEESRLLYDAVAPVNAELHFREVLAKLDRLLPGVGPLADRYTAYRQAFVIPPAKLDAVFQAAIAAGRERTAKHLTLPPGESFTVEYVTNKPWGGYNWYKGNYRSVIQVNTDLPIYIDRAVDLACHEGYPGHHVYNALLEKHLVRDRGWVEFTVYPLFSPQSLIAEGSANYGIAVAFPGAEQTAFERDVLFPLAGLDPKQADNYDQIVRLMKELSFAGNEAARRYLNGQIDAKAAAAWLTRFTLAEPARAEKTVRFYDTYRSYVINYNLGEKMVREYVEAQAKGSAQRRWDIFAELISSPRLPSGLK